MSKKSFLIPIFGVVLCLPTGVALAADAGPVAGQVQNQMMYGSQLMTPKERVEYRAKLRAAKTIQERERIRQEHHEEMMELAKKRGVTLPAVPPAGGAGMGPGRMNGGAGMGSGAAGMGPGAGMMGTGAGGGMGVGPRR
ncbi:hypothetical protein [Acidithiobacillus sp.]|uniref:hypothetical protein n=1 Tax=Acidithiobacillus sp. TaxID=1872118 RepID=UPI0025C65419|nr:hypothetical protein [Acidithiobacillus sp.]